MSGRGRMPSGARSRALLQGPTLLATDAVLDGDIVDQVAKAR